MTYMTVILLCRCPSPLEKVKVLKDMIFPNCEKLGQTIIFVRMRDTSRQLHKQLEEMGFKITSIQVRQCVHTGCGVGCGVWCIFVLQVTIVHCCVRAGVAVHVLT
jgi:hypothetical protein